MRNLKLILAYDGTDFHGWQRQPGLRTVQGDLEDAIARLTGASVSVNASGRTDAGVHALGQAVNFQTPSSYAAPVFLKALNAFLPLDVRVLEAEEAAADFHATLSARSKMYRYVIDNAEISDPLFRRYSLHIAHRLDEVAMHEAGRALWGTHDFRGFETNHPNRTTSVRTISRLDVFRDGRRVLIEVEADGFLYNMVRAIAGTLILVGSGRREPGWVGAALAAEDRRATGPNVPPQGLFLVSVNYRDAPGQGQSMSG